MSFQPTTAIVTGSDSGIGRATAVALAAAGMDVGVTWHSNRDGAEATAEEVRAGGRRAVVARLDTSELPGCGDVVDRLADELGGLDVLVNNAGTGSSGHLLDLGYDEWRHTTSTARWCASSGPPGGWCEPAAAGGSSRSPACTSTSHGSAASPTTR